jgi:DNA repair photolyase
MADTSSATGKFRFPLAPVLTDAMLLGLSPQKPGACPHMITLTPEQMAAVAPALRDPIEYRKSGLSLNHIIGCPLDCSYCVRHLFGNFEMKQPTALMPDREAVARLISHRFFVPHRTPLQIFNRATDPFLPTVKPHLFATLAELDQCGFTNHVLVITRYRVTEDDSAQLNRFAHLRVTLLITYSGISDSRLEPVDSNIALESLRTAYAGANRYRVVLYWRPLVPGINDSVEHIETIRRESRNAHAVVFTGLFYRDQIRDYYAQHGLQDLAPDVARRKILPRELEARIVAAFREAGLDGKLFRKTSCGVAFAHGVPDYNGHYGIREICDICPRGQLGICASDHRAPATTEIDALVKQLGGERCVEVTERAAIVSGLDEQRRYFIQHRYHHQIHDVRLPHLVGRHGRAEVGWAI